MRAVPLAFLYTTAILMVVCDTSHPTLQANPKLPQERPKEAAEKAKQRELHVVCLYEGNKKTGDEIHGGRAVVTVDRPGKALTLFLSASDSVTWLVAMAPGTDVEKVILGGYHRQAVTGLPKTTEIVDAFYEGNKSGGARYLHGDYKMDSARFRTMVRRLHELTGMQIASFHGLYRFQPDNPFLVDKVQEEPRLSTDYPKPTPLADLPKLEFKAHHYAATANRHSDMSPSYGDFTLTGPKTDSLRPLPKNIKRLAYDPANKKYYGLGGHEVYEVDLEKQTAKEMGLSLDVPRLSWPSDITFDTKRQRLVLRSGWHFFAYAPASGKWTVIAEKVDVDAFTYHPKHDVFYGVQSRGLPVLTEVSPEGTVVRTTSLGEPMFPGCLSCGPGVCSTRVIAVDDYIVIIGGAPGSHFEEGAQIDETFIFLVDPKTNKVHLTSKTK